MLSMKKLLLFLFIGQVIYLAVALKCYKCKGNCKEKTEDSCPAAPGCCYTADAELEAGGAANATDAAGAAAAPGAAPAAAAPAAAKRRKRSDAHFFEEYLQGEAAEKGCCTDDIKKLCDAGKCKTCTEDLCNKGFGQRSFPGLFITAAVLVAVANTKFI